MGAPIVETALRATVAKIRAVEVEIILMNK